MNKPFFLTTCCFELDSLRGKDIAKIIGRGLGFMPQKVRSPFYRGRFTANFLEKLQAEGDVERLTISGRGEEDRPSFQVFSLGTWAMQVLAWETTSEYPDQRFIEELSGIRGFNSAYLADAEDVFWQSETDLSNYELFKRAHHGLRIRTNSVTGRQEVDVSDNPARRTLFPHFYLQVAPRMWFAGLALRYISEARLLSFALAERIEKLDSGAIEVELFTEPARADSVENRRREAAFRRWVGFDELETHVNEVEIEDSDPVFEVELLQSDRESSRVITHYFDSHGNLTRRSKAVSTERVLISADGTTRRLT